MLPDGFPDKNGGSPPGFEQVRFGTYTSTGGHVRTVVEFAYNIDSLFFLVLNDFEPSGNQFATFWAVAK